MVVRCRDVLALRVEAELETMAVMSLCELPEPTGWSVHEFLSRNDVYVAMITSEMEKQSGLVEFAIDEVLTYLMSKMEEKDKASKEITMELTDIKSSFNARMLETLLRATRGTLDAIKRHLTTRVPGYDDATKAEAPKPPFFSAEIVLSVPNIIMSPTLDEMQQAINKVVGMVLGVSRGVTRWGHRGVEGKTKDTYGPAINDNKEVIKIMVTLSSSVNATKKEVTELIDSLARLNFLWKVREHHDVIIGDSDY
jgi:dynein heavy chain